jgi:hypothetical protein
VALRRLLAQGFSLRRVLWTLWLDGYDIAQDRIVELLLEVLDSTDRLRDGIEGLDDDDSDDAWERIRKWETRRPAHPLAGRLRRALGRDRFTTFAVTSHAIATGVFEKFDGDEHGRLINHGYCALLYAAYQQVDQLLDDEGFCSISAMLDPSELRHALQSAKQSDLEQVRKEFKNVIIFRSEIETLGHMISDNLSVARLLTLFDVATLETQAHLLLLWLAVRRSDQIKKGYTELIAAADAVRSNRLIRLEDGIIKIID